MIPARCTFDDFALVFFFVLAGISLFLLATALFLSVLNDVRGSNVRGSNPSGKDSK